MGEVHDVAIPRTSPAVGSLRRPRVWRVAGLAVVWTFVLGNGVAIFWLWAHGGNLDGKTTGEALTSVARITGLLSAYLALLQVVLLARIPALERLVGFDRLTVWHRWNGHATIDLVVAHVFFSIWGYALMDKYSIGKEISTMIWGGIYPGMIVATIGTAFLLAVVATSYVIVRRRLRYEWWYAVHVLAYAGIALAWFHQIPTGNELVLDTVAADYWRALYVATIAIIVGFRVIPPLLNAFRYGMRVAEVVPEGPGVVSIRITGRRLDRLHARPGQFFQWRFLNRWWTAHPFSLSEAPDGSTFRITVKALGDDTAALARVPVGTRVVAEGPFGVFTDAARRGAKRLLIAGGIGITPVRALGRSGDVVIYRAIHDEDLVLLDEVVHSGAEVHTVVGDHAADGGDRLLAPEHLLELVPDLVERDVYVCGPPGMTEFAVKNVRAAGVPRRRIHVERFAL
jgi:predicted ferric reductase